MAGAGNVDITEEAPKVLVSTEVGAPNPGVGSPHPVRYSPRRYSPQRVEVRSPRPVRVVGESHVEVRSPRPVRVVGESHVEVRSSKPSRVVGDWVEVFNSSGQTYWLNKRTNESTEVGAPHPVGVGSPHPVRYSPQRYSPQRVVEVRSPKRLRVVGEWVEILHSSGQTYWLNTKTNASTEVGAPYPGDPNLVVGYPHPGRNSPRRYSPQHVEVRSPKRMRVVGEWVEVLHSSGQTYWLNRISNETTELGAPRPDWQLSEKLTQERRDHPNKKMFEQWLENLDDDDEVPAEKKPKLDADDKDIEFYKAEKERLEAEASTLRAELEEKDRLCKDLAEKERIASELAASKADWQTPKEKFKGDGITGASLEILSLQDITRPGHNTKPYVEVWVNSPLYFPTHRDMPDPQYKTKEVSSEGATWDFTDEKVYLDNWKINKRISFRVMDHHDGVQVDQPICECHFHNSAFDHEGTAYDLWIPMTKHQDTVADSSKTPQIKIRILACKERPSFTGAWPRVVCP